MSRQAQPRKRRGLQDKYIWQAGDVQASTYRGPRPKVGEEEEKARSLPKSGGRWRTLRDGRRVYVTGARRGAMAATWGTQPLSTEGDPKQSVSPNYLLKKAMEEGQHASVEANDVLGFNYLYAAVPHGDVDPSAVDFNKELGRIGHTKQFVEEMLADPTNEDFFRYVDDSGGLMVESARKDLAGEYYAGRRTGVSANIIFVNNTDDAGRGVGGRGGMKVFYAPYDGRSKEVQDYMHLALGVDPLFVTVHELHHALGSNSEFDMFSDVMAVATHFSLGNNLAPASVGNQVFSMVCAARSRAVPSKDCRTWPRHVRRERASLRWLYDNFPEQLRETYESQFSGGWDGMERLIKRWRTSYEEKESYLYD